MCKSEGIDVSEQDNEGIDVGVKDDEGISTGLDDNYGFVVLECNVGVDVGINGIVNSELNFVKHL